ncbi:hypothetical protein ONZ45_g329 [Pleurotus djamor]|nr:hypothetical protein ONZ45_g329 [Pleurotus djamor]
MQIKHLRTPKIPHIPRALSDLSCRNLLPEHSRVPLRSTATALHSNLLVTGLVTVEAEAAHHEICRLLKKKYKKHHAVNDEEAVREEEEEDCQLLVKSMIRLETSQIPLEAPLMLSEALRALSLVEVAAAEETNR